MKCKINVIIHHLKSAREPLHDDFHVFPDMFLECVREGKYKLSPNSLPTPPRCEIGHLWRPLAWAHSTVEGAKPVSHKLPPQLTVRELQEQQPFVRGCGFTVDKCGARGSVLTGS